MQRSKKMSEIYSLAVGFKKSSTYVWKQADELRESRWHLDSQTRYHRLYCLTHELLSLIFNAQSFPMYPKTVALINTHRSHCLKPISFDSKGLQQPYSLQLFCHFWSFFSQRCMKSFQNPCPNPITYLPPISRIYCLHAYLSSGMKPLEVSLY